MMPPLRSAAMAGARWVLMDGRRGDLLVGAASAATVQSTRAGHPIAAEAAPAEERSGVGLGRGGLLCGGLLGNGLFGRFLGSLPGGLFGRLLGRCLLRGDLLHRLLGRCLLRRGLLAEAAARGLAGLLQQLGYFLK